MAGSIFVLQEDGTLDALCEQPYASEALLQRLLAKYPDLLAGDQMNADDPPRWLLVARETGIPLEDGGGEWMSLGHLFLDQDGVPTLVEVKRSTDVRIRREVVGQMLDYASHAVAFWTVDAMRARFADTCEAQRCNPDEALAAFLTLDPDDGAALDAFWQQVGTNLRTGRIRLLFVADVIPSPLLRVIEFLNRFMDPVQVLGVEVHQYVGDGLQTLVPRLVGDTAATQGKSARTTRPSRQWDEESFFAALRVGHGDEACGVARRMLEWATPRATRVFWGKGTQNGSFVPVLRHRGADHQMFAVWTSGTVELYFQYYQYKEPFADEGKRRELLARVNAIDGVEVPADAIARRPGISLHTLRGAALEAFLAVYQWVIDEILAT